MIEFITELFEYQFLQYAVLAALLAGISCGIIGSYIVARRLVFMSGGVTHSSFGGIGIAYYIGADPILGAMVFAIGSALGIEFFSKRGRISEDAATGVLWSLGMSIGIIFVFLTPGYAPNLMSFLFGNILLVTGANIFTLACLDIVLILILALLYRPILYTAFDRSFAASQRLPTTLISNMMMVLIAMTIVLNIKTLGIVMLLSLLTMPVVIVNSVTKSYLKITIWSSVVAVVSTIVGLYISYLSNIPTGATSIAVLAVCYGFVKLVMAIRSRI